MKLDIINIKHEDAILRTFILFVQTSYAVMKYTDAHLYKNAGLSTIKFIVLKILANNGGTMAPSEIARWTIRERHNITTLLDRLEQDKLVRTSRNRRDKRFMDVTITRKGRSLLRQAMLVAKEIVNQVMTSISETDAIRLEILLSSLRQEAHHGLERISKQS